LELKEEFFPFAGGYGGYGNNGNNGQYPQPQVERSVADVVHLKKQSTHGKISALKYFFLQLMSTQSDVQMGYWMNRALITVLPQQLSTFKLYKNYLSIFAVSSAIQLHDSFTLEAYLEDFNEHFEFAGQSALLSESVAERNVYQAWQQLVTMRLYLFYISMYESSIASQFGGQMPIAVPLYAPPSGNTSFVEVEAEVEAEPTTTKQNPQSAMLMQYAYMAYFAKIFKYYALFYEMSIPQYGLQMAHLKVQGYNLLTDGESSNDDQGEKLVAQGNHLDDFVVSNAIAQWSGILQTRYIMEYYTMMFEFYLPQMATQRILSRIDSAMLNTNLMQMGSPKVEEPKTN